MIFHYFRAFRRFAKRLAGPLAVILLVVGTGRHSEGQADSTGDTQGPYLRTSDILELTKTFNSAKFSGDSYPPIAKLAYDGAQLDARGLSAFEENRFFVYALGGPAGSDSSSQEATAATPRPSMFRRFMVLRPSIFLVDDEVITSGSQARIDWRLYSRKTPEVEGRRVRVSENAGELLCQTLLPEKVTYLVRRQSNSESGSEGYVVEIQPQDNMERIRYLHLLYSPENRPKGFEVHSELNVEDGQVHLTISAGERTFHLSLPPPGDGAGNIAISESGGKTLLSDRFLPSGVLPRGLEGMHKVEDWDLSYNFASPPLWDTGQPSLELRKVVEAGTVHPCRVVELGCGSGTDSVYLASRGFDVVAIDIAPTALSQAQEKARRAGVKVQWLLADVLAAPDLKPFDFIYDRGCYHAVRSGNLAAYLETVRRYSHSGTQFLLLAAKGEELTPNTPGVSEEDIRHDFLPLFDFEWLRENRLEFYRPGTYPPVAWSVLLRRKASP